MVYLFNNFLTKKKYFAMSHFCWKCPLNFANLNLVGEKIIGISTIFSWIYYGEYIFYSMKSEILIKHLSEKVSLSAECIDAIDLYIQHEIYKPHQIIQAAGNIENRLFYVESGFARNYFYDEFGNEHTVRIWEPGDIMFSYEGYYKVASYFYVEILSQSQFISLSYEKLNELEKEFIEAKLLIRYFLLQFQKKDFEKQQLVALPAEERYIFFRKYKNHFFSKINSKIIASYLQLSAKTLSRYMSKR